MFSCTTAQHIYCTNCTVCNWTVLTVITQKLLLYVQLHNTFTVQILYKLYSLQLNCTYSNYTEAAATCCSAAQQHNTFIVQILYKYCTNCTVCNWTVLTVITQKPLLHVQLHNSTTHLLYKYCTKCTVCNWTVLTVITHKLPLYVQLPNSTENVSWCLLKWITAVCLIFYAYINTTALRNSYVCSCPVSAGRFIYLSVIMEWRHSGQWVIRHHVSGRGINTYWSRPYDKGAPYSAICCVVCTATEPRPTPFLASVDTASMTNFKLPLCAWVE